LRSFTCPQRTDWLTAATRLVAAQTPNHPGRCRSRLIGKVVHAIIDSAGTDSDCHAGRCVMTAACEDTVGYTSSTAPTLSSPCFGPVPYAQPAMRRWRWDCQLRSALTATAMCGLPKRSGVYLQAEHHRRHENAPVTCDPNRHSHIVCGHSAAWRSPPSGTRYISGSTAELCLPGIPSGLITREPRRPGATLTPHRHR